MRYLVAAAFVCFACQVSPARAYSCNDNHYVNSSGLYAAYRALKHPPEENFGIARTEGKLHRGLFSDSCSIALSAPSGLVFDR